MKTTINMAIEAKLMNELIKEAKDNNYRTSQYIELLLKTHQDRVSKFVSILKNPK